MIYFDNNATTKTDDRVIQAMLPFMNELYANPSSTHAFGNIVKNHLENSREIIANFIGAIPPNIVFTSGATESINIAIKGVALGNLTKRNKILAFATEHKAVLETCKSLQTIGYEVEILPVKSDGLVDLTEIGLAIDDNTLLVCAMLVNNETGVIQPIAEIAEIVKSHGSLFFCDATQAPGKLDFIVDDLKIDMLCFSGHKFYGPKGIGVLFVSNEIIDKQLLIPLISGGGQENGLRSGTQIVPAIIGLAEACKISNSERKFWEEQVGLLRDKLELDLLNIQGLKINGDTKYRVYNTTNICFPNFDVFTLTTQLKDIYISNGSACSSMNIATSHVLLAMGLSEKEAFGSIRFSLGKFNTFQEVELVIKTIRQLLQAKK